MVRARRSPRTTHQTVTEWRLSADSHATRCASVRRQTSVRGLVRAAAVLALWCSATACDSPDPSYADRAAALLTTDERAMVGCYLSSAFTDRAGARLLPERLVISPLAVDSDAHSLGWERVPLFATKYQVLTDAPIPQLTVGQWVVMDRAVALIWHETTLMLRRNASSTALVGRWSAPGAQDGIASLQRVECWPTVGVPAHWPRAFPAGTGYEHARAIGFDCNDAECRVSIAVLLRRPDVFRGLRIVTDGVALLDRERSSIGIERGRMDLGLQYTVPPGSAREGYHKATVRGVFMPTPGTDIAGELADVTLAVVETHPSATVLIPGVE